MVCSCPVKWVLEKTAASDLKLLLFHESLTIICSERSNVNKFQVLLLHDDQPNILCRKEIISMKRIGVLGVDGTRDVNPPDYSSKS